MFYQENFDLLGKYWKDVYSTKLLIDERTMKNDLTRAIGSLPLQSATRQELQYRVNEQFKEANKHRRIVTRLNQLLRYLKRDFKLQPMKKKHPDPKHLTLPELSQLADSFASDSVERTLIWVAFGTGCRIGEIFALDKSNLRQEHVLLIKNQYDKEMNKRETKTRRERKLFVIPESLPYLHRWFELLGKERAKVRNLRWAEIICDACEALWPDLPEKHLVFHDLRHSFAIHLVNRGVGLTQVAQMLGNSVTVAQEHYAGFTATDEGVDMAWNLYQRA